MRRFQTTAAFVFVGLSVMFSTVLAAFDGGLAATPYGTKDSKGFVLGFNNRLTAELYEIVFRNTSVRSSANAIGVHGIFCLLLEVAALGILFVTRKKTASVVRDVFFAAQLPIFMNGVLGLIFAPFQAYAVVTGSADGETFTDGVPVLWVGHGVWIFVSLTILVLSWIGRRDVRHGTNCGAMSDDPANKLSSVSPPSLES